MTKLQHINRLSAGAIMKITLVATGALLFLSSAGCRGDDRATSSTGATRRNLVVLNAPVGGTVRRVLVGEGVRVRENAPIIEIATAAPPAAAMGDGDAQQEARLRAEAARSAANSLQREVERASVEVQRMEGLVAQNAAPPAQLDAARAVYQRAQERLQAGQVGGGNPSASSLTQIAAPSATNRNSAHEEATVLVRATAEGNVRVISVRPGQRVFAGQPVATLAPELP